MTRLISFVTFLLACTESVRAIPVAPAETSNDATLQARAPAPATHQSGGKEHIVIFGPNSRHANDILHKIDLDPSHPDVVHVFDNPAFSGFIANMKPHCITQLNAMSDVSHVEETTEISSLQTPLTRSDATWGLQRISSSSNVGGNGLGFEYTYSYTSPALGSGVDVYVIDTGIDPTHATFTGRAILGWSAYNNGNATDDDGHGTHVSGTAAGDTVGVASNAAIIGVKVLNNKGTGVTSNTLRGMEYVVNRHAARRKQNDKGFAGSVVNMSWSLQSLSSAVAQVVSLVSAQGVHMAIAAGNDGKDACTVSPAASGGKNSNAIITVGSVGLSGDVSSFSNTGPCVDIYAPGEDVLSAWPAPGGRLVKYLSGTSMATPHVTGVMAYLIAQDPSLGFNPPALKSRLVGMSPGSAVGSKEVAGSSSKLLNNGVGGIVGRLAGPGISETAEEVARTISEILPRGFRGSFSLRGKKHFGIWSGDGNDSKFFD